MLSTTAHRVSRALGVGRRLLGIVAVETFGAQDRLCDVAHLAVLVLAGLLHASIGSVLGHTEPPHENALRPLDDLPRFEHAAKVVGFLAGGAKVARARDVRCSDRAKNLRLSLRREDSEAAA